MRAPVGIAIPDRALGEVHLAHHVVVLDAHAKHVRVALFAIAGCASHSELEDLGDPKVQTVMRARTLTVLRRLDPSRKEEVMQFLLEADLVNSVGERDPSLSLMVRT